MKTKDKKQKKSKLDRLIYKYCELNSDQYVQKEQEIQNYIIDIKKVV